MHLDKNRSSYHGIIDAMILRHCGCGYDSLIHKVQLLGSTLSSHENFTPYSTWWPWELRLSKQHNNSPKCVVTETTPDFHHWSYSSWWATEIQQYITNHYTMLKFLEITWLSIVFLVKEKIQYTGLVVNNIEASPFKLISQCRMIIHTVQLRQRCLRRWSAKNNTNDCHKQCGGIIGHVNEYPTMHYFGIPRHTQSMIAYKILTEYFWKFQWWIALWECC